MVDDVPGNEAIDDSKETESATQSKCVANSFTATQGTCIQ